MRRQCRGGQVPPRERARTSRPSAVPQIAKVKNGVVALGRFTPLILRFSLRSAQTPSDAGRRRRRRERRRSSRDDAPHVRCCDRPRRHRDREAAGRSRRPAGCAQTPRGETALDWARKSVLMPRRRGPSACRIASGRVGGGVGGLVRDPARDPFRPASVHGARRPWNAAWRSSNALAAVLPSRRMCRVSCAEHHRCHSDAGAESRHHDRRGRGRSTGRRCRRRVRLDGSQAVRAFRRSGLDIPLYTLLSLAAADHPADRATDALVFNILAQQQRDGRWHVGGAPRPPMGTATSRGPRLRCGRSRLRLPFPQRRDGRTGRARPDLAALD